MKVGLLFGSFNPPHMGHLILARYWLNETDLTQIWLVVSPQNPHKSPHDLAPVDARLAMTRLAVEGDPALLVSDVELHLPRPSYTIHTLNFLRLAHPLVEWVVLLGADAARSLPTWREGARILSDWSIWVYPRPGTDMHEVPDAPHLRKFPEAPLMDLSATRIRAYCARKKSIRYLVPPPVEAYIREHRLYADAPAAS